MTSQRPVTRLENLWDDAKASAMSEVERLVYRLLHGAPVWERPRAGHAAREG